MLSNLRVVFENWCLSKKVLVSDLSRCYRCIFTSHTSKVMRLIIYPKHPLDPNNTEWDVIMMSRATYGDQVCSCLLEVVLREIVAPKCKSELARRILSDQRYVDDLLAGGASEEVLREAMLDIETTLGKWGLPLSTS